MDKIQTIDYRLQTSDQNSSLKNFKKVFGLWFLVFGLMYLFSIDGFCDILRLKEIPEGKEGNEVEILEQRQDSFIVEIPNDEIEFIKRRRAPEFKLWKERRILWEDTGDYITIYLPKEKIVLPEDYPEDEFDSAAALKKELKYSGAEGRPQEASFWKGTGRIIGRILKDTQPLKGARLKIVSVSPAQDAFSRIFGPKDRRDTPEDLVSEAISDELGYYEFNNIPLGEYDIYWSAPDSESWYRRLSEKPDIAIGPGETVEYPDIEIRPSR